MLKQAFDFALLEDFDHLYRYANLYDLIDGERRRRPHRSPHRDHTRPADDPRAPAPDRRRARALFDAHRGSALAIARDDHRRGGAEHDELLHEPWHRLDRADRTRAVCRDRDDRRAARHALRVADRSARHVAQAARVPRVQRGLSLLVDAPARERHAHSGAVGAAPGHGDRPAARGIGVVAQVRGRRSRRDLAAGPSRRAVDLRTQQAVRARHSREPVRPPCRRRPLRATRRAPRRPPLLRDRKRRSTPAELPASS